MLLHTTQKPSILRIKMGIPDIDCNWLVKQQEQQIMDDKLRRSRAQLARYKGKASREGLTPEEMTHRDNLIYWLKENGVL